jgi:hypothetical protein
VPGQALSANDPVKNPRGLDSQNPSPARALSLPEGTALQVFLLDPFFSKKLEKKGAGATIQFEVTEDVVVDGVTAVRRRELATAHLAELQKAKMADLGEIFPPPRGFGKSARDLRSSKGVK